MHRTSIITILLSAVVLVARSQCPLSVQFPCSCSTSNRQLLSVLCDGAGSLKAILQTLGNVSSVVESLVIANTPIPTLFDGAFGELQIRRLSLRYTDLELVEADAFSGPLLDVLESLEIHGNPIEQVPLNSIIPLRALRILTLSNNAIRELPEYGFLRCNSRRHLQRLDLSGNTLAQLSTAAFVGLETLEALLLDKNEFQHIPSHALEYLSGVEELSLAANFIEEVRANSLPLPNLKSLSLEVNNIHTVDANAFTTAPALAYLYLGNNAIAELAPTVLLPISRLKALFLSGNPLTRLDAQVLKYVPNLSRLEAAGCQIDDLEDGVFRAVPSVQVVNVARNQIRRIRSSMFAGLPFLYSLDLSGNEITTVEDFSFSRLNQLSLLNLCSNQLETLPPNTLFDSFKRSSTRARVLILNDNPLNCDLRLAWLREWLRSNPDVQITTPGSKPTRCARPPELEGKDLRSFELHGQQSAQKAPLMRKWPSDLRNATSALAPHGKTMARLEGHGVAETNMALVVTAVSLALLGISIPMFLLGRYLSRSSYAPRLSQWLYPDNVSHFPSSGGSPSVQSPNLNLRLPPTLPVGVLQSYDVYGANQQMTASRSSSASNKISYWWF